MGCLWIKFGQICTGHAKNKHLFHLNFMGLLGTTLDLRVKHTCLSSTSVLFYSCMLYKCSEKPVLVKWINIFGLLVHQMVYDLDILCRPPVCPVQVCPSDNPYLAIRAVGTKTLSVLGYTSQARFTPTLATSIQATTFKEVLVNASIEVFWASAFTCC